MTATVTAIAIFGATQAVAAPQPPGPPPAGSQHTLQAKAEGVRLTVRGDTIVRDFRGKLKVRVTGADKRAPWHLTFTIVKINITSSANGPYGRLKLKTKLEASTKNSTLRTTQLHPLRWKSDVYLDFTLKAGKQRQQPPGTERQALHVSTAAAGEFTGSGKAFPPKNGHYTLKKPIKLAKANGNGKVLVKINKFPLELSS